jgi:hypothetical protein
MSKFWIGFLGELSPESLLWLDTMAGRIQMAVTTIVARTNRHNLIDVLVERGFLILLIDGFSFSFPVFGFIDIPSN